MSSVSRAGTSAPSQIRTDEPLFWLNSARREVREDATYFYDARRRKDRQHAVLQYTLRGCGFHEDRDGRKLLPAGTAFLRVIPGPFSYGYASESAGPYDFVFLALSGEAATQWYKRLVDSFGHVLTFAPDDPIREMLLDFSHRFESAQLTDRYLVSSQVYHLLMMIYSVQSKSRMQTHPRTTQALELIARHAPDPRFNVNILARHLDCSREYLSRQFRQATGVSPSDYLLQHRLKLAARQMRHSSEKLESIAHRSGFSNANYLCRVFKENVGVTCATFRAQSWIAGP